MTLYFLDTSAIVKRYIAEQGQQWMVALSAPAQGHEFSISQAALVEVVATFCRKVRDQHITVAKRDALIDAFKRDVRRRYSVVRVTNALYYAAGELCKRYPLRAYDAIQLACCLAVRDDAFTNNEPAPIFVCADNDLLAIAQVEGLSIENPNNYS